VFTNIVFLFVEFIFSILSLFWKNNKMRLMRSPCCLCVHLCLSVYPSVSLYLSVYPLPILLRILRLMRSPCRLCVHLCVSVSKCVCIPPPIFFLRFWGLWYHITVWSPSNNLFLSAVGVRGDSLRWPRDTLYPLKLALTSPTSGGRSVSIVRLRTKAPGFVCFAVGVV
jgi:hypothetical protein